MGARTATWAAICLLSSAALAGSGGTAAGEEGAHVPIRGDGGVLYLAEGEGARRELDDVTAYCLACHGEEMASGAGAAEGLRHSIGPEGSSHPVDRPYPVGHPEYVPLEDLDPRLVLDDGQLSCLSCHLGEAADHRPALPEQGSELCRACHRL